MSANLIDLLVCYFATIQGTRTRDEFNAAMTAAAPEDLARLDRLLTFDLRAATEAAAAVLPPGRDQGGGR